MKARNEITVNEVMVPFVRTRRWSAERTNLLAKHGPERGQEWSARHHDVRRRECGAASTSS
jgi:hypothetical protein